MLFFPKFLDFKSIKLSAAALKATTLKANKKPQANPTKVGFDNRFLKITLRSLVENMNTPIVEITIPIIVKKSNLSKKSKYHPDGKNRYPNSEKNKKKVTRRSTRKSSSKKSKKK